MTVIERAQLRVLKIVALDLGVLSAWSGFGDSVYRRRWCSVSDYRDRAKR